MKVLLCHAGNLHQKTLESVRSHAPSAEVIDTSGSDTAYWEAVKSHWNSGADLVIIEQDIEITSETLPSFESCPESWCMFSYYIGLRLISMGMGCVRFRASFQDLHLLTRPLKWHELDHFMLQQVPTGPHIHGVVDHHHKYTVGIGWQPTGQEGVFGWMDATYDYFGRNSVPGERPQVFTVVNGKIVG